MGSHTVRRWLAVGAILALPVMAHAQEATLSGTVSDTTGGALPGVTVRALHEASGNSFEAVTDARGEYRLPVRVGAYRVTAELAGFAPVTRSLTVLVGQQAVVNLQMGVSAVQESVTVTGEAPLLDTTETSLGGNIDPRQLQELPVNGRNWLNLVMLAPGSRTNSVNEVPVGREAYGVGNFQLNMDGQQISHGYSPSENEGQPRYSRDAIAEFEILTSRFDVTQGRSTGLQVNAVSKSGTNTPSGSFSGYFRDDSFNAADFVAKKVLPYQDQQLSGTFGGPIRKDKVHFFANYEYEREPQSFVYTTPYPSLNSTLSFKRTEKKGGVRLDAQFSPRTRLSVRESEFRWETPFRIIFGLGTSTPSTVWGRARIAHQVLGTLTQVLSNRVVNEVKAGYTYFHVDSTASQVINPNSKSGFGKSGPEVQLQGLTAGGSFLYPQDQFERTYSIRDDFTASFSKGGRHTVKLGGEYLQRLNFDNRPPLPDGSLDARGGPVTDALLKVVFPNQFDATTWNLAPLSSIAVRWRQGFASDARVKVPRYELAGWVQDDWTVSPRTTLNLGVRYDLEHNAFSNDVVLLPYYPGNRSDDRNNVGPRLGANFSLDDRTVVRGGYGLYFGSHTQNPAQLTSTSRTITTSVDYDGRPDFATNPWNGPAPTFAELLTRFCTPADPLKPGCIRKDGPSAGLWGPNTVMPYSHQASIGLQRQVGTTMAIEADYVYVGTRGWPTPQSANLTYNPATGANYALSDISKRVYPYFGAITLHVNGSRSNQHALQTTFTKRFSQGWQASGTYTLSGLWDAYAPPMQGLERVPFPTAADMGGEYGLAVADQRHRATFNGIWQLRYGFQLSGLYFFGSGERYNTRWGADLRGIGLNSSGLSDEQRLRPNGTIVPRNNFVGKPIHRVDLRVQRRFPLGGRAGIDGILEVFNLFNHVNYGAYTTSEVSSNYGLPSQAAGLVEYFPRTLQLGFRLVF